MGRSNAALLVLGLWLLVGCGTRVDHAQVVKAAGAGTVSLTPETVRAVAAAPHTQQARSVSSVPTSVSAPAVSGLTRTAAPQAIRLPKPSPAASDTVAAHAPPCPVAAAPVAIGQVGFFSGVASGITGPAQIALGVWVRDINTRGGLHCHPVKLWSEDDAGDPARTSSLVKELAEHRHVVALVSDIVVGPGAFYPAVESVKVPAIGGSTGSDKDFENPWSFPDNPNSVDDLIAGLLREGASLGHRRLGVVYCVESTICSTGAAHMKAAAEPAGVQAVYETPASVTQPDYTAPCLNARNAKVDLLAVTLDGASIARLARSCAAIGYRPLLAAAATVFSPAHAADPTVRSFGVATVTGEAPWFLDDRSGLHAYQDAIARYAPSAASDASSMIAWASAELLRTALDKVAERARSGPITTSLVLQGLGMIHDETLGGLTAPLTFTPHQAHATRTGCVFFELLADKGWTAPRGSKPVCPGT